jgi:O-antigen/teichoic acid export membrane protein
MLSAVMTKYYEENDVESIKLILNYSTKYFLAIAIPSTFGLALLSKPLLMILSPPQIALNGYFITPFVALSALFYGMYVFFAEIIAVKKRTSITGRIWVAAAILSLGLNFLLIPRLGIIGGAASVLMTYAFALVLGIYYSRRYIPVKVDLVFVAKSLFASSLMSLIIVYIQPSGLMQVLAVTGACALFYGIVLILLRGFNQDEFGFVKGLMGVRAQR